VNARARGRPARVAGRILAPAAVLAAALAPIATITPTAAGEPATAERSQLTRVGRVTRTKGQVTVGRGIPVVRRANLRGGDLLSTGPSGEANVTLALKRFDCTVWSNTQLRIRPSRSVGYQLLNGDRGDLACATLSRSRRSVAVRGPQSRFTISMNDPVFSVSVRGKQAVVKVARGVVVVGGRSGLRNAILVARGQQSVVPTGGDPLPPQRVRPTRPERTAFARLQRLLPALTDTTPPRSRVRRRPATVTASSNATFAFGANERGARFSCSLDGGALRFCPSRVTLRNLAPGRHTLAVRATDQEGNTGSAQRFAWTITGRAAAASGRKAIARDATDVRLAVDAEGRALVTYQADGRPQRVLAWGAVNARASGENRPQVGFQLQYGAEPIRDVCEPYRGPQLEWLVVACTAPDGTHWALQQWRRALPNQGLDPTPQQATPELRLSHWSGPIAVLELKTDWAYRGRYHHLYGRLTYRGKPVYGSASTARGTPLDPFGRNLFVDTLDSAYGPGWRRENSFLTHNPTGAFCYGFYPRAGRPAGRGSRYRATVVGPGVTPDVFWEGPAPGPYDAARDAAANQEQRRLFAGDTRCVIN
jgi:hypothetical protein